MTTAAEIIGLQTEMMGRFREPDPTAPRGALVEIETGRGTTFTVPVSAIGRAVDRAMFGERPFDLAASMRGLTPGRHTGLDASSTVAPLVAHGVAAGRAYRVQENMTDAIMRRADGFHVGSTFFDIGEADDGAAQWRLAVESHRSVREWAGGRRWSDDAWWRIWRGVLALRWALNERRGAPEGYLPSRELAVREPGPLVPR